tara:strand:- start:1988 stop:4351 length:2364 start_codon:yes stop_codon:yes gene_type:complete
MQKLQLYIGTERVDLFKDETVSFTQTIQNVKDIQKIFTEFSKTFSLPASSVNQKIFSHYYNFDIQGGFDARNKVAAKIELNTIPFKEGFIKLEGVDLKNNVAHTYRITFFGNTINLVDVLGDDQLSRLTGLGTYDTTYEYSTIKSGLISALPSTKNLCVPLITHTNRLTFDSVNEEIGNVDWVSSSSVNGIDFKQLKFALRLQAIIDAIELKYPSITFSNDFFNNSSNERFHNLWMWLHRKKGSVEPTTQLTLNFIPVQNITQTSGSSGFTNVTPQGVLTLLPVGQTDADGGILHYIETKLELVPTDANVEYSVRVLQNSESYEERLNVTGSQVFFNTSATRLSAGSYTVEIASLSTITFASTNIEWTISGAVLGGAGGGGGGFTDIYSNSAQISSSAIVPFTITQQIPEMTVINFLTSIFKMFNLTAFVNNEGVIVVKTLDSYYASGSTTPIVIDEYLDVSKSTVNVALPFKEIAFGYKGLGTFLAKQFNQVNNSGWGSTRYTLDNDTFDAPNNIYKVEIPFEHVMYERLVDTGITTSVTLTTVQYGYFVNDNQESYYGLPLIFYAIRQLNQNPIALKDGPLPGGVNEQINDYIIPSNSLQIGTSNQTNINFNAEINEFDGTEFLGTLFNNNYRTYIDNVFNTSRRLIKVNAVLPQKIFHNLELNNLIQIRQQNYQINSITTNLTNGRSQLELLNVGNPYFRSLENITFQGTSGGTLYYNFSIGVATSITVGDTMFTNQTLTTTAGAGSYIQSGSATNDTYCDNGCFMTMILNTSGIVTSITCGCP